jgi:benzylsuccinate CoA-transferase BbsE subunit
MGALTGYRVLDLSGEVGHFCGKLLAGMGAEVVKVEPPGGDRLRRIGPFLHDRPGLERSLRWLFLNTGKRGITLDPTRPDGRRLLELLLGETDVVIESFDLADREALGWAPRELAARYPHLVWASVTGFGREGPQAGWRWSDLIGQATGGLMFLVGDEDRPPVRMGPPQAYYQASTQAAVGIAAALFVRGATGRGQQLDVSMQEAVTYALQGPGTAVGWWVQMGGALRRLGDRIRFGPTSIRIFQDCADGQIANGGSYLGPWLAPTVEALAAEGLAGDLTDPKWQTAVALAPAPGQWEVTQADVDHIVDTVGGWLRRRTKAELFQLALDRGLMIYPVNTPADLLASAQLQSRQFWERLAFPALGETLTLPGAPFKLSRTPWAIDRPAPALGQDNTAIYGGRLGLSTGELSTLSAGGII